MPTLCFIVPAHGRTELAQICLRQLRRTCDALTGHGIEASAIVIADDRNLDTARTLGFGTIRRDNTFLSRKFNDGIQAACDPHLTDPPHGIYEYRVLHRRGYRGHPAGTVFAAHLTPAAERRALDRRDIELTGRDRITYPHGQFTPPYGWDETVADYVVPCGSDDWVDHRILRRLPRHNEILAFRQAAFVNETATLISSREVDYQGGVGIRIYPRSLLAATHYRPADEDRRRACDTSILVNVTRAATHPIRISYGDLHQWQIVDWKSPCEQLNDYAAVTTRFRRGTDHDAPFLALADHYPAEALNEMRRHYHRTRRHRPVAA